MSDARTTDRYRIVVLIALCSALALGSFWMREVIRKSGNDPVAEAARSEPDYYVEKFNFVKMSKTGEARYKIAGIKLAHNPQDDSYEIQQPDIKGLGDDRPPMTMRSDRALVEHNNTRVHMLDNVRIDRPASATSEHFHLESDYMLLLPDDDVMQTDKPVRITLGTTRLNGTGLFANNATREFRLTNQVRGIYQAAPAH
jgi:lipopolysaccharide export system protein LptC